MSAITKKLAAKVLTVVDQGLSSGLGTPTPGNMCVEAAVCYAMGLPHGDNPDCVSPALRALKISLNDKSWSSKEARAKGLRRLAIAQLGSKGALDEKEFLRRVAELAIRKSVPVALRAAASVQTEEKHKLALEAAAVRCEKEGTRDAAAYAADAADAAADAADAADAAASAASAAADAADAAAYAASAAAYAAYAAYAASAADAADAADAAARAARAAYAADAAARAARAAYAARAARAAYDKVLADFAEGVVQILIKLKAPGCKWLSLTE